MGKREKEKKICTGQPVKQRQIAPPDTFVLALGVVLAPNVLHFDILTPALHGTVYSALLPLLLLLGYCYWDCDCDCDAGADAEVYSLLSHKDL